MNKKTLRMSWNQASQIIQKAKKNYDWIMAREDKWAEKAPVFIEKVIEPVRHWFNAQGNLALIDAYAPVLFWFDMVEKYFQDGGFENVKKQQEIYKDVWEQYVRIVNQKIPYEEAML